MEYLIVLSLLELALVSANFARNHYASVPSGNRRAAPARKTRYLHRSLFPSLESYQVGAKRVTESSYPWAARVIHSKTLDYPFMCTAICVDERIFITAARCILTLKVNYTRVVYLGFDFSVTAFVTPTNPSTQFFEDIGVIVVDTANFAGIWATIEMTDIKRTDNNFDWFQELNLSGEQFTHKVVGYAAEKFYHRLRTPEVEFSLTELEVIVGRNICSKILTLGKMQDFYVPCYLPCTYTQFTKKDAKCKNYHGVEGSAIFSSNNYKLLGIATWGAYFYKYELPVGFSIPNSDKFFKDYACAKKIRDSTASSVYTGYYQSLCDEDQ